MVKIILSGCNGQMGRVIAQSARTRSDCTIVAGIDPAGENYGGFHVFSTAADSTGTAADVVVDFSHPAALEPLVEFCITQNRPLVVATTGLSTAQLQLLRNAAEHIPVFHSANMSLGVNLMAELAKTAARVLGSDFDIEIIEKHHNRKIDAPSGTALLLADEISSVLEPKPQYVYDRHSHRSARTKHEIGIHAIRGGTIAGDHDVLFAGNGEVLTISHSAGTKELFAVGSLNAALFLADKPAGFYTMKDLLRLDARP